MVETPQSNGGEVRSRPAVILIAELRRGLGRVFIVSGLLHWALMIYATLYALGKLSGSAITVSQWNNFYLMHFIYTYMGGALYIARKHPKRDFYAFQLLVDFMVGVVVFYGLFQAVKFVLVRRIVTPWVSLSPGAFLLYYGAKLYRGRQVWSGLELL